MRHVADRFTATLDANVLYPFGTRDVLLSLAEAGLYRPQWSQDIMDEWSSHLIRAKPQHKDRILRTISEMQKAFPEAMVEGYRDLIDAIKLPDPKDRHVLAAAIKGGSNVVVTNNLKDFPDSILADYDIEVRSADDFALNTFQLYEADALVAIRTMRNDYDNPPMTADELLKSFVSNGLVSFAAELTRHVGSL